MQAVIDSKVPNSDMSRITWKLAEMLGLKAALNDSMARSDMAHSALLGLWQDEDTRKQVTLVDKAVRNESQLDLLRLLMLLHASRESHISMATRQAVHDAMQVLLDCARPPAQPQPQPLQARPPEQAAAQQG